MVLSVIAERLVCLKRTLVVISHCVVGCTARRLKLLRPKFACCGGGQETARDEVAAGATAAPDDADREPAERTEPAEAKSEQQAEQ